MKIIKSKLNTKYKSFVSQKIGIFRDKKADSHEMLSPEVIKITLAILCLLLLVYLGYKLASIFIDKHKIDQAKAVLEDINGKISNLKNQGDNVDYSVRNPAGWWLTAYNSAGADAAGVAAECKQGHCICIGKSKKDYVCKTVITSFSLELVGKDNIIVFKKLPITIKLRLENNKIIITQ